MSCVQELSPPVKRGSKIYRAQQAARQSPILYIVDANHSLSCSIRRATFEWLVDSPVDLFLEDAVEAGLVKLSRAGKGGRRVVIDILSPRSARCPVRDLLIVPLLNEPIWGVA